MMNTTELFFALLRCATGSEEGVADILTREEWYEVFDLAKRQAVAGVVFLAIEKLPTQCRPPRELLLQWWTMTEQIKRRSQQLNETGEWWSSALLKMG